MDSLVGIEFSCLFISNIFDLNDIKQPVIIYQENRKTPTQVNILLKPKISSQIVYCDGKVGTNTKGSIHTYGKNSNAFSREGFVIFWDYVHDEPKY